MYGHTGHYNQTASLSALKPTGGMDMIAGIAGEALKVKIFIFTTQ
jgi:hypothetical protein